MKFKREKIRDFYLLTTDVENIFINEYMPGAPGNFVKVYMYGLLYSQNEIEMPPEKMAKQLSMDLKEIEEAWNYWESLGAVKKISLKDGGYDISFRQIRAMMYGSTGTVSGSNVSDEGSRCPQDKDDADIYNEELRNLLQNIEQLKGTSLSPSEIKEIFSLAEEDNATTEVILLAAEYCCEKGKTGINYIAKVVREWTKEGLKTKAEVKEKLAAMSQRNGFYKKILRTLGLNRGATEAEKEMIDSWVDDMQFSKEKILEACVRGSFISNPNLRYVNRVLHNWFSEAKISGRSVNSSSGVSQAVLNRYYAYLRHKAETEADARRCEIYAKIPEIKELDQQLLELGQNLSKTVLSGDKEKIAEIRRMTSLLEKEKAVLLTENNYREDYTDIKYACSKCGDTGITEDGGRCSCTRERMGEAELWQNLTSSEN